MLGWQSWCLPEVSADERDVLLLIYTEYASWLPTHVLLRVNRALWPDGDGPTVGEARGYRTGHEPSLALDPLSPLSSYTWPG